MPEKKIIAKFIWNLYEAVDIL